MGWPTSSGAGDYPDVDHAYLDRLADALGEERLREHLADRLLELTDRLDQLRRIARADRRDELAAVAHDMVATAGHIGLKLLSLAAADLEHAARQPDTALGAEVEAIRDLAERAFAELRPRIRPGTTH